MQKNEKMQIIRETGIIAIMRAKSSDQLILATEALIKGGVKVIEVTMTTPNALETIEKAKNKFDEKILFGAGSVLDSETARSAILSGAGFIVAPTFDIATIELCLRYSIPVFPGCFSPSEILKAWHHGASMVKVFPSSIGGPSYIKAVKSPLPQIDLVPVGGVNLENAAEFINCGATALGVGGELINQEILSDGNFDLITQRSIAFVEAVKLGRMKA